MILNARGSVNLGRLALGQPEGASVLTTVPKTRRPWRQPATKPNRPSGRDRSARLDYHCLRV